MRSLLSLLYVFFAASFLFGADIREAVVRIASHGASGTVIFSKEGLTKILTCAHAFPNDAEFLIDCPWDLARRKGGKLTKINHRLDLAVIEVAEGPWPVVCPIADKDYKPGKNIWAVGYPEMSWPQTRSATEFLSTDERYYYTKRLPIPGESGGSLVDIDLGVCFAVTKARFDSPLIKYGIYTNLKRIHEFEPLKDEKPVSPIIKFLFPR